MPKPHSVCDNRFKSIINSLLTITTSANSDNLEQDLETIWDEATLRQLLDRCSNYEGRRQIRARLRTVMAEQKGITKKNFF
ncbi:hypothetical protein C0J52_21873 [Blattella germanica]|nr:hypothetical protein C0J52_21873 [Blattella germanica]